MRCIECKTEASVAVMKEMYNLEKEGDNIVAQIFYCKDCFHVVKPDEQKALSQTQRPSPTTA